MPLPYKDIKIATFGHISCDPDNPTEEQKDKLRAMAAHLRFYAYLAGERGDSSLQKSCQEVVAEIEKIIQPGEINREDAI